jgi:hypothetical protein
MFFFLVWSTDFRSTALFFEFYHIMIGHLIISVVSDRSGALFSKICQVILGLFFINVLVWLGGPTIGFTNFSLYWVLSSFKLLHEERLSYDSTSFWEGLIGFQQLEGHLGSGLIEFWSNQYGYRSNFLISSCSHLII